MSFVFVILSSIFVRTVFLFPIIFLVIARKRIYGMCVCMPLSVCVRGCVCLCLWLCVPVHVLISQLNQSKTKYHTVTARFEIYSVTRVRTKSVAVEKKNEKKKKKLLFGIKIILLDLISWWER